MQRISKMDFSIIDARVRKRAQDDHLKSMPAGFLRIVVDQIFPAILATSPEIITDGGDDRGIDVLHIVESENAAEVFLVQSKYRETHQTCDRTINDQEILKISLFLTELFDQADTLQACNNLHLREGVRRIWDMHRQGKFCRYHIIFCSNGRGLSDSATGIIRSIEAAHSSVSHEFWGASEIIRSFHQEGAVRESGRLQVLGKEILERSDGDVRGVIATVDARSFIELISEADHSTIKRHLFDDNLRVFLGVKGGYNPAIIETATSRDSHLFWYLNNGITITCKTFSYNKGHVNPLLNLNSFQIVNGAQTSHSLFEAFRSGSENIENVALMVRVYATERPDITERVAVATNSQARIQSRDLRANTEILKQLELAFLQYGYYFERKRQMHANEMDEKRIDALKLGQILMSFDLHEPDRARSDSDAIFESRFSSIFHAGLDIPRLISLVKLHRYIERLRSKYEADHGDKLESGHPHQYLVYGHWFVLFACSLLSSKNHGGRVPEGDDITGFVEDAIKLVAAACGQQKAVAHYQLFRSPRTREKIIAELSAKQLDFLNILSPSR